MWSESRESYLPPSWHSRGFRRKVTVALCAFISGVIRCFFPGVHCLLFADALKLFCHVNSEDDCLALQLAIGNLEDWCSKTRQTASGYLSLRSSQGEGALKVQQRRAYYFGGCPTLAGSEIWKGYSGIAVDSQAVADRGAPLSNCWAFIDGTARRTCRPTHDQKDFSGHNRHHCVKYQSILAPVGIIVNLQGSYMGKQHDSGILAQSDVERPLRNLCVTPNKRYVRYGDPAYATSDVLVSPFPAAHDVNHLRFNSSMSKVRQAVKWGFGKIVNIFAFVDYHKNEKMLLQDVGKMYQVATILTNCHTCLYRGLVCDYFDTAPPTLEQYLR